MSENGLRRSAWDFFVLFFVYFHLSLVSYLVFKWLAPLRRARIALLGLYHLLAILFFFVPFDPSALYI